MVRRRCPTREGWSYPFNGRRTAPALSTNSWIEGVLDVEDMRRRCLARDRWMADHPKAVAFADAWADRNLDELADR